MPIRRDVDSFFRRTVTGVYVVGAGSRKLPVDFKLSSGAQGHAARIRKSQLLERKQLLRTCSTRLSLCSSIIHEAKQSLWLCNCSPLPRIFSTSARRATKTMQWHGTSVEIASETHIACRKERATVAKCKCIK